MNAGDLVRMKPTGDAVMFFPELIGKFGVVVEVNDRPFEVVKSGPSKGRVSLLPNFWRKDKKLYRTGQAVLVQVGDYLAWHQTKEWETVR